MALVGSEKPSVQMCSAIATELLDELSAIPLASLHASSTWTCLQTKNILLALAEFLIKIESSRLSVPGLTVELWDQTSRIDQGMQKFPNMGFCRLEEPFIGQVKCQCSTVS